MSEEGTFVPIVVNGREIGYTYIHPNGVRGSSHYFEAEDGEKHFKVTEEI